MIYLSAYSGGNTASSGVWGKAHTPTSASSKQITFLLAKWQHFKCSCLVPLLSTSDQLHWPVFT